MEEVLAGEFEPLLAQIEAEIPEKPLRNGSQVRIKTLKVLCELLAQQDRKLNAIYDKLCDKYE